MYETMWQSEDGMINGAIAELTNRTSQKWGVGMPTTKRLGATSIDLTWCSFQNHNLHIWFICI